MIILNQDAIPQVIELLKSYKFTITLFKENLVELQPNESLTKKYEKVTPSLKTSLTKKYNECFKTTAIKRKKNKEEKEAVVKYNEDGDIIDEEIPEEEEEKEEEDEVVVKEVPKKGATKGKKK